MTTVDIWRRDKALLTDFRNFLFLVLQHLGKVPTKSQYEIAEWLQHGPKRKMVQGFRGVGKSWITAAYVLWRLYCDPEYKVMVVSANKEKATEFSYFVKRLMDEMDILRFLRPEDNQRNTVVAFDVGPCQAAQAPSVRSVGIFGQMTGGRPTEVVADDTEVPKNSQTMDSRDKLFNAVLEFEALIVPDIGQITYLGTPQTEESIYTRLRERGYKARIWPARYPSESELVKYGGDLAPSIVDKIEQDGKRCIGKSTDPERFSDIDLMEREGSYGRSGFQLQFMLDTTLSDMDRYPLRLSDLIIMPLLADRAPVSVAWCSAPEKQIKDLPMVGFTGDRWFGPLFVDTEKWVPYEGAVMSIDPSGKGKDLTSFAVVKSLLGKLWLSDIGGFSEGYSDETLVGLAKVAKAMRVNYIIIEENFGSGMFTKLFRPVLARFWPCTIEEVRHSTQKERRIIDVLEPLMNQHRLVVDIDVVKRDWKESTGTSDEVGQQHSLFYQLTRITKDRGALKRDDKLDALAMACEYWAEAVDKDEEQAVKRLYADELERSLREFMDDVGVITGGRRVEEKNWCSGVLSVSR